ncbi:MAG: 50S ribosomal protein L29 [Burkholderiales bacterium]
MKTGDLRAKTMAELEQELIELRRAQFGMRVQLATHQNSKVSEMGRFRWQIARVRTLLAEKARQS